MSIEPYGGRIPEVTLGWRLKLSLGEMSRDQIAEVMDVVPSTISRWMADKGAPPKRPYLIQWALATGVDLKWLETGQGTPTSPGPGRQAGVDRATQLERSAQRHRSRRASGTNHRYAA